MEQQQPLTIEKVDQILGKYVREAFLREEQLIAIIQQYEAERNEKKDGE